MVPASLHPIKSSCLIFNDPFPFSFFFYFFFYFFFVFMC